MNLILPDPALILLIGPSGSGKSTFARRHFEPAQILSVEACRAILYNRSEVPVSTQATSELLYAMAAQRMAAGLLTVIDDAHLLPETRKPWIELARANFGLLAAIVFDLPETVCQEHNRERTSGSLLPSAIHRQCVQLKQSISGLKKEPYRCVYMLTQADEIQSAQVKCQPLAPDRRAERGPFDLIGDLHGCCDELENLLAALGYHWHEAPTRGTYSRSYTHPAGRKLIFLGDLVDRGPRILDCVQLVLSAVRAGHALAVPGNHDDKLLRKLKGRDVQVSQSMQMTMDELDALPPDTRDFLCTEIRDFLENLPSHLMLDGGNLAVAHGGMKTAMQGRETSPVRAFALYGETTGETDAYGLPVRLNWAADYTGHAKVVYGHTPVVQAEWQNNTIDIDTGCVFGGKLTALRYPEMELVSVPAVRAYTQPHRPLST